MGCLLNYLKFTNPGGFFFGKIAFFKPKFIRPNYDFLVIHFLGGLTNHPNVHSVYLDSILGAWLKPW